MALPLQIIMQAAALPVSAGQVCIITSRSSKRWVIPKGCLEPDKTAPEIALQEAWEEAGLLGQLRPDPLGTYRYEKWDSVHEVTVFWMDVRGVAEEWPEQSFRERRWVKPALALRHITDRELREVLRSALVGELRQLQV